MASFEVWRRGGIIAGVQTFTETTTTTTSSGGGGYLHQGSGYIASPTSSTTTRTTTTQRVFVQDHHGEWTFNVGEGFAVRPGNHIMARFINSRIGGTRMHDVDNLSTGKGWLWPIKNHLPRTRWIWSLWFGFLALFMVFFLANANLKTAQVEAKYGISADRFAALHGLALLLGTLIPAGLLGIQYTRRGKLKREIEAALRDQSAACPTPAAAPGLSSAAGLPAAVCTAPRASPTTANAAGLAATARVSAPKSWFPLKSASIRACR